MLLLRFILSLLVVPKTSFSLPSDSLYLLKSSVDPSVLRCEWFADVLDVAVSLCPDKTVDEVLLYMSPSPVIAHGEADCNEDFDKRGIVWFNEAQRGDSRAQQSLGLLWYNNGKGGLTELDSITTEERWRRSAFWHSMAAVQGNLDALAILGGCVRTGKGVEGNRELGMR